MAVRRDQTPVNDNAPAPSGEAVRKCPICGKSRSAAYKPFCSKRCADVDLNRWLNNAYFIPSLNEPQDPARKDDDTER